MSSSVHFKFKSQKEPSRVTFDGTAISVFDLKREIIQMNKLGDGTDFELAVYNEGDNTEYDDDTTLIPRSTSVIARRLPAVRPGRGGAARYVSGKAPTSARHASANEPTKMSAPARVKGPDMNTAQTEEERVKAMFNLEGEQWRLKQQEMASEQRVPFGAGKSFPKKTANVPEGEPPRGYVCYRCGKKGHWIQACPTNDDPNYEGKARIKRTTGIPRSMLKTIDKAELDNLDDATRQQMMINGDGDYVIAQTDEKEWRKHQERVKASAAAQERASKGDQELHTLGLECPIDKRLFVEPVRTPCCQMAYCHECISTALIDSDLTCPNCSTENVTLEELVADQDIQQKMDEYKQEKVDAKLSEDGAVQDSSGQGSKEATPPGPAGKQSAAKGTTNDKVVSKKRSAEDISDSTSLAAAAPEMKRQRSGEGPKSNDTAPETAPGTAMSSSASSKKAPLPFHPTMPPDMTQMMQSMGNQNMNFPLPMPGMPSMPGMGSMPFMPNMNMNMNMPMNMPMNMNMMNPGMMGMGGHMGSSNFNVPAMNGFPHMNGTNGTNGMNFPPHHSSGNFHNPSLNNSNNHSQVSHQRAFPHQQHQQQYQHQQYSRPSQSQPQSQSQSQSQPATAMPGVPTGPRQQNVPYAGSQPQASKMANKFSNQQRPLGNDEDNAYMRQPVNPHRHQNRQRRVRPSDYRELGA